ncbi:hypothetical protein FDG2_4824 [Candidatus Protofrankia californiensis]|uniref:Uncharacterized protein n=1 Tax=Candidatus Protofrankia californiensis TaxID=1839754 RepID=A0A1C3P8Q9_9ACTN|nr:hypothetical protein FDG2_4824 [Candidatus Protofrankia californiensis]
MNDLIRPRRRRAISKPAELVNRTYDHYTPQSRSTATFGESNQTIKAPTWAFSIRSTIGSHNSYLFAQVRTLLLIVVDHVYQHPNRLILVAGPEIDVRPVATRGLTRDDDQ